LLDGLIAAPQRFPDAAEAATELKALLEASRGITLEPGPHTNRLVSTRILLNRDGLCDLLRSFADRHGPDRVILVQGDEKSGKSYSKFYVSAAAAEAEAKLVQLDLDDPNAPGRTDAQRFTQRLLTRFGAPAPRSQFDDFAQDANRAVFHTETMLGYLSNLREPTWLVIDNVHGLQVDQSARDLVWRLCEAVDTGECSNLWLVLVGVAETDAVMSQQIFVSDRALPPRQQDVRAFIDWFLAQTGKTLADPVVAAHVEEVMTHVANVTDATDGPTKTLAWQALHGAIHQKCAALR